MIRQKDQPAASLSRLDGAVQPRVAHRPAPRSLESADLFDGSNEVLIQHRGREYRLRITQNGKLILNA